jgi:RNA 3'-terminal phosphate cyclase (ATP)
VEAHLQPCPRLRGVRLAERGPATVKGFSAVAGLPASIARRQARRAASRLAQHGFRADFREEEWEGGPGTVLAVEVDAAPVPALFVAVGERGKRAERVADAALDFLRAGPAPVDLHSGDQLLLPLALADGPSEYRVAQVTRHLTTNAATVRRFLDREVVVEGAEGSPGVVRVS